jgi:L-gulonolactone oxidase
VEEFLDNWRRRLGLHAVAIFLLFGGLIGFRFMSAQDQPLSEEAIRLWRLAHLEGLTRSFILFGLAGCFHYLRLSRSLVAFTVTTIIIATWSAVIGAVLTAEWGQTGRQGWTPPWPLTPDELVRHRIVLVLAGVATIGTMASLGLIVLRAAWEALREGIAPRSWKNWARNVHNRPRRVEEPEDFYELQQLVQKAIDDRINIRALGSGATWNPLATTRGMLIRMEKLDGIQPINSLTNTVTVEAGVEIRTLCDWLWERGYTLVTTPVISWIQVGGALATCSHGTGISHPQFSDIVSAVEILHDKGGLADTTTFTRAGSGAAWNRVIVNLGAMGIVWKVTLDIVPKFNVRLRDVEWPMRYLIENDLPRILTNVVDTNQKPPGGLYTEILWYPYNEKCVVKHWYEVPENPTDAPWERFVIDATQYVLTKFVTPVAHLLMSLIPWLSPLMMKAVHILSYKEDRVMRAHDAMQYIRRYPRVVAMSYAIEFDADPANPTGCDPVKKAWLDVVDRIEALKHDQIYPLNMVLHVRFLQGSNGLLNPSYRHKHTCHIEMLTAVNTPRHAEFFAAVEREWRNMEGRPHWGKITFAPDLVTANYPAANLTSWNNLRLQMDPKGIFLNDYLREVLGLKE